MMPVTVSIVSHRQAVLVANVLADLRAYCKTPLQVVLTLNVEESLPFDPTQFGFPVEIIRNKIIQGFAANHNAAFAHCRSDYYCVLNPDIRLAQDPFPALIEVLADATVGVAAPRVVNAEGGIEDSARQFPTPGSILKKALLGSSVAVANRHSAGLALIYPDWVAGMCMLFRSETFRALNGFDEQYFLYYEDVDLCWRLHRQGLRVALVPAAQVVHQARRDSHRKPRYLIWHLSSMLRFFIKRYS
jgi:GT2 family glycosyltransferase